MSDASVEGAYATVMILGSIVSLLTWIVCSVRKKKPPLGPPSDYCKRDFK